MLVTRYVCCKCDSINDSKKPQRIGTQELLYSQRMVDLRSYYISVSRWRINQHSGISLYIKKLMISGCQTYRNQFLPGPFRENGRVVSLHIHFFRRPRPNTGQSRQVNAIICCLDLRRMNSAPTWLRCMPAVCIFRAWLFHLRKYS